MKLFDSGIDRRCRWKAIFGVLVADVANGQKYPHPTLQSKEAFFLQNEYISVQNFG